MGYTYPLELVSTSLGQMILDFFTQPLSNIFGSEGNEEIINRFLDSLRAQIVPLFRHLPERVRLA
jgi:hypothetical protein